MLQRLGDALKGQKWLAYLVLGALALVFAAWGAYGIVNLNIGGANYAAEAGGQKVSIEEARNLWLRQQAQMEQRFGGEIPAVLKTRLQDQVLESLVRDALLKQRTHDLGYRIGDKDLQDAVRKEPAFQMNGQYSPEIARAALAQAGLSEPAFEDQLRNDLQRAQLEGGIRLTDFLTPAERTRIHALENQQREVRYAVLNPDKFQGNAPDDAALQAYYKAHQAEYMTPESVHLQYAELRLDQLAAQVTVSDADLHAAYDKQKSRFVQPETRHARHILIPVDKDDAAARKQAEDVLAQAKSGKDFAELAKKYSQDPGSAQNGGDLGWGERSNFGALADTVFAMSAGELRGPVKTQFGYHIVRLDEVQQSKGKTFEEVRPELESDVRRDRATDRFGEIQEQLQSKLGEPGTDLNAVAKEFNLQTGEVAQFLRGAGGAPLGPAQPLQEILFGDSALAVATTSAPTLIGDDRLAIVRVLERRQSQPKPLAEVRDGIVTAIKKQQGTDAALKAAEAARAKLESGTSFDDVARELGVTADPAKFVGRGDPSVPAQVRDVVFDSPKPVNKPVYRAVKLDTGGAALVAITKLREESDDANKQLQASMAQQEALNHGTGDVAAYVEEMRRTADVRKNPKAFE